MAVKRVVLLFAFLAVVGFGFGNGGPTWKTFRSVKHGYSVVYPGSWFLFKTELEPTLDSLDILNFSPERRVSGVILIEGGARIMVGPAPEQMKTIEQWVKEDTKFSTEVRQRRIEDFTRHSSGCLELFEATSIEEVGPNRYFSSTSYYCATERGLYIVSLLNWKGDRSERQLRAIALRIALSLRLLS